MSIVVHIEELILHGVSAGDRVRIGAALIGELERLVMAHGLPPGLLVGNGAAALDGGAFVVPPGARPDRVGAQIARSVYFASEHGPSSAAAARHAAAGRPR